MKTSLSGSVQQLHSGGWSIQHVPAVLNLQRAAEGTNSNYSNWDQYRLLKPHQVHDRVPVPYELITYSYGKPLSSGRLGLEWPGNICPTNCTSAKLAG